MEQFVLVPASVYNKSVTTQSVTKQELPKFKTEQPRTYQIDSLKREINKKMFGKADTLIDKIFYCSRIKRVTSASKVTSATRKFKRTRAFARVRNEIWCMNLTYVDKLVRENNGVKYLLVPEDLFHRTV